MEESVLEAVNVLWDYMHMGTPLRKAQCIVGFGCYSEEIALRSAELYLEGWAPRILFTGGLGRNTKNMWTRPEAERFARLAMEAGVPEDRILMENRSTNTGENILFTREILEKQGIRQIIGVHKPFMERRVQAAMGVYWPEADCVMTSPQVDFSQYAAASEKQGISRHRVVEILAGDFQRLWVYAEKGYQLPQQIPEEAMKAFETLVCLGYTGELVE